MEKLLEETQQQTEEMEAQQEELRITNEELIHKTNLLEASEEELRVQQEELSQANFELNQKAVELVDKNAGTRVLCGQDWEVISPLAPQMLNYLPAAFAGDIQYRRAQIRFET